MVINEENTSSSAQIADSIMTIVVRFIQRGQFDKNNDVGCLVFANLASIMDSKNTLVSVWY